MCRVNGFMDVCKASEEALIYGRSMRVGSVLSVWVSYLAF